MKQIKTRHKLIPAIIMLLVAAITMSTASYAWFTMSSRVEVSGIELSVVAPTNILIREYKDSAFATFSNKVTVLPNPTNKLNHASSADGVNMFSINKDTAANANPTTGVLPATGTVESVALKHVDYNDEDGYYFDYKLQLINTGGAAVKIGLDDVEITDANSSPIVGAVRFAILNSTASANIHTNKPIFAHNNESPIGALTTVETYSGTPTTSSVSAVNTFTDANGLFTLAANGELDNSKKDPDNATVVTVRVWIEGQDADCITDNSNSAFQVKFEFYVIEP